MKILLLGNKGQVGWELHRALLPIGEVIALDSPELDFMNLDLLREQVTSSQPQIIINAAAYTAVDKAESQPEIVNRVNVQAPALLADLACEGKAVLVHFSTDYVFDGTKKTPYTEDDAPNPLSLYAKSKLAGDQEIEARNGAFFIMRSSWIYSNRRDNFVKKVFGWAHTQTELRVVTDQVSCPTWARSLAEVTAQMLCQGKNDLWDWAKAKRGIYNAAGNGYASRYEWAEEILRLDPNRNEQTVQALKPALTADFPADACRPLFTALDCRRLFKTFGLELPDWRVSLHLAIDSM